MKNCKHSLAKKELKGYCARVHNHCKDSKCCNDCVLPCTTRCKHSPGPKTNNGKMIDKKENGSGPGPANKKKLLVDYTDEDWAKLKNNGEKMKTKKDNNELGPENKPELLASVHKIIGRIQMGSYISKFALGSNLVFLKRVKKSKVYKDVPGVGTWEEFCNSTGYSVRWVDEQLKNLETFGQEFLELSAEIGIKPTDLRRLRQLPESDIQKLTDGSMVNLSDPEDIKEAIEDLISYKDAAEAETQKKTAQIEDGRQQLIELEEKNDTLKEELAAAQAPPQLSDQDVFKKLLTLRIKLGGLLLDLETIDPTQSAQVANELLGTMEYYRREINLAVLQQNQRLEEVAAKLKIEIEPIISAEFEIWTGTGRGAQVRDLSHDHADHAESIELPNIEDVINDAEGIPG